MKDQRDKPFNDTKQIHIFCDIGRKKVLLMDSHLNKVVFARTVNSQRKYGEYLALSFALRYIRSIYKYRDILLITDAKSQSDVLNGNSVHSDTHIYKKYSDDLKTILNEVRYTNIVNILWVPRRFNDAGRIESGFKKEKLTLFAKTNFEQLDFNTLERTDQITVD